MNILGKIKNILKSVIILSALVFGWLVYSSYDNKNVQHNHSFSNTQEPVFNYDCLGKINCSEMNSCEEAKFYLINCPDTQLDPDGDGIPCETGVCAHD